MVKKTQPAKAAKLGRQDRWPSDYGVRDAERERSQGEATAPKHAGGAADKGPGRKGHSRGRESAGESRASAGPDRKKQR